MFTELQNMLYCNKSRKTAFIENEKRITFCSLSHKAMQIANKLKVLQQNKVAIYLPDGSAFIFAICGIILSGKIAFPINTNYVYSEITSLLNFVQPAIITSKRYSHLFERYQKENQIHCNILYIEDFAQEYFPKDLAMIRYKPQSPALFLNTSGTSGNPKIVMLSDENIHACAEGYLAKLDFSLMKGSKYILASPFTSAYGLMIIFACLKIQYALVILKMPFSMTNFIQTAEKYQVTIFEGGSPVIQMMWQLSTTHAQLKFKYPVYYGFGGSKISSQILQELQTMHPQLYFWQGYGMTEASPLISKIQVNHSNQHYNSVGTAIQGETIQILQHNKLTDGPNITGEIVVKGNNIMLGYYKNKSETRKVLKKGFLYTGDIGYFDENKYLHIVGRKKNIVIIRGMNVSKEEVENAIIDSGYAKDCMVYARKDRFENEVLCANVVPLSNNVDTKIIIDYCKKHLASYKVPRIVNLVNKIEKTITGKNRI